MKDNSKVFLIIGVIIIAIVVIFIGFNKSKNSGIVRKQTIESNGPYGIRFDENANPRLDDPSLVDAKLEYDNNLKKYVIHITAKKKEGDTILHITSVKGIERTIAIKITENSISCGNDPKEKHENWEKDF